MVGHTHPHQLFLLLIGLLLEISGCGTVPDLPVRSVTDEARSAMHLMQEREKEFTAVRADMASTRIAAAKQEAELQELRATAIRLRRENGETHQSLLEAKRALEARETEVAVMKVEREQLAGASARSGIHEPQLAALHETVASLSQELARLKETLTVVTQRTSNDGAKRNGDVFTAMKGRQSEDRSVARSVSRKESAERIIPTVHVLSDEADQSKPLWITVQPGESWWSLARKHHTTMNALRAVNGRVGDHLTVGEAIRLP